jgi:asparagine synthase (glutamine-hydrolysing)
MKIANYLGVNQTPNDKYWDMILGYIDKKDYCQESGEGWPEIVIELYQKSGDTFFAGFRGSFSGALFDKEKDKWIIFTDHIGSKHIYYDERNGNLLVSSEMSSLYDIYYKRNIPYSLDPQAAYMLLSYGYMLNDYTLCKEIKRLKPGSYLTYQKGNLKIKNYYSLPEEYDYSITENEAIEKVDKLFRKAIELQFEKDKEYGYKHLVALSGGLDSRMTTWVAHEMGYTDQLNFTFSQSDYLDETIAKNIAADLKHEWLFKALDNGVFLKNLDEVNRISGGHIIYYGLSHGYSALKYINFDNLGILHSGQLGDVVIGSFAKQQKPIYRYSGEGAYSKKLLEEVDNYKSVRKDPIDYEKYLMLERGFNGALTGSLSSQLYTETMSPFYDVELLDFCLKIPLKMRVNHKLYKKWILKKYPQAAEYIWEKTKTMITNNPVGIPYKGRKIPLKQIPSKVLNKLGLKQGGTNSKFHMNPLDYWYKTNPDLKKFQDTYFDQNIDRLSQFPDLRADCKFLYNEGTAREKNQVLSLLSAMKLFF